MLAGRKAAAPVNFLGRFHNQVAVLNEGTQREFLGWQKPGFDQFSITRAFASSLNAAKTFAMTTSTGGSKRARVPGNQVTEPAQYPQQLMLVITVWPEYPEA